MTKIPSVEERVEEFEKLLDENEGITVGEDITPYVYDIITADRLALLTELRESIQTIDFYGWNEQTQSKIKEKVQAHLDELIKSTSL